jgi:hypothetical protein
MQNTSRMEQSESKSPTPTPRGIAKSALSDSLFQKLSVQSPRKTRKYSMGHCPRNRTNMASSFDLIGIQTILFPVTNRKTRACTDCIAEFGDPFPL